jgi:hypothetical protein
LELTDLLIGSSLIHFHFYFIRMTKKWLSTRIWESTASSEFPTNFGNLANNEPPDKWTRNAVFFISQRSAPPELGARVIGTTVTLRATDQNQLSPTET